MRTLVQTGGHSGVRNKGLLKLVVYGKMAFVLFKLLFWDLIVLDVVR